MLHSRIRPGWERPTWMRNYWLISLLLCGALIGLATAYSPTVGAALFCVIPLSLYLLLRFPGLTLGLLLCVGNFKADPLLARIFGPVDVVALSAILVLISTMYYLIKEPRRLVGLNRLWPIFALSGWMIFTLVFTPSRSYGTWKAINFLGLACLGAMAGATINVERRTLYQCLGVIIVAGTLKSVQSVLVFISGGLQSAVRFTLTEAYLGVGRLAGASCLIGSYWFGCTKDSRQGLIAAMLVTVNLTGVVASGGRGPMFMLVPSLAVLLFAFGRGLLPRFPKRVLLLWGAILVALVPVIVSAGLSKKMLLRAGDLVLGMKSHGSLGASADTRLSLWRTSIDTLLQHPITGVGVGGFSWVAGAQDDRFYPHNLFLEIGCELGIPGLLLLISAILKLRRPQNLLIKPEELEVIAAIKALFVYALLNSLVSGDINDNRMLFVLVGLLVPLYHSANEADEGGVMDDSYCSPFNSSPR